MWWWVSVAVPAAAHRRPVGIEDVLSFRHVLQITGQLHRGRTRPTDAVANTRTSPDGETREPFLQTSISAGFLFQLLCWFGETVKKNCQFFYKRKHWEDEGFYRVTATGRTSLECLAATWRANSSSPDTLRKWTCAGLGSTPFLQPPADKQDHWGQKWSKMTQIS